LPVDQEWGTLPHRARSQCIVPDQRVADYCLNHGYEPQSKLLKQFRSKLRGTVPRLDGIIRLTNFYSLRFRSLGLITLRCAG
jgi:hypothetical protein